MCARILNTRMKLYKRIFVALWNTVHSLYWSIHLIEIHKVSMKQKKTWKDKNILINYAKNAFQSLFIKNLF